MQYRHGEVCDEVPLQTGCNGVLYIHFWPASLTSILRSHCHNCQFFCNTNLSRHQGYHEKFASASWRMGQRRLPCYLNITLTLFFWGGDFYYYYLHHRLYILSATRFLLGVTKYDIIWLKAEKKVHEMTRSDQGWLDWPAWSDQVRHRRTGSDIDGPRLTWADFFLVWISLNSCTMSDLTTPDYTWLHLTSGNTGPTFSFLLRVSHSQMIFYQVRQSQWPSQLWSFLKLDKVSGQVSHGQ